MQKLNKIKVILAQKVFNLFKLSTLLLSDWLIFISLQPVSHINCHCKLLIKVLSLHTSQTNRVKCC